MEFFPQKITWILSHFLLIFPPFRIRFSNFDRIQVHSENEGLKSRYFFRGGGIQNFAPSAAQTTGNAPYVAT